MSKIIIIFFLVIATNNSIAEPTPLVAKLMDTPASMFDLGLLKAQRYLDSVKGYTISYNWDKNKFIVQKYFSEFGDEKLDCKTEGACKDFLKLKTEEDTKYLCFPIEDNCNILNIASEFSHSGYSTKNFYNGKNDSESVQELRNLFYVNTILIKKFNGLSKKISCERSITETRAMCSDAIETSKK